MKKWLNLENLICFAVFLLPAYLIKINILGLPSNVWEAFFGLIFVFWIFTRGRKIKPKKLWNEYKKYIISAGLIFFGFLFSLFSNYTSNLLPGLGIIKGWFLIPIAFFLMTADIFSKDRAVNIFKAYYLSAFFVAIFSLAYLILGRVTYDGRLEAFFDSPNYLAMYLAPALLITYNLQLITCNFRIKIFYYSALFLMAVSLYFTYSYAAWISLIFSVFAIFFIKYKLSFKKILLIFAILIFLAFSQIKNDKFLDFISFDSRSSLSSRAMIWRSAGKMIEQRWIFGIGPGNFQKTYLDYQKYYPPYLEWAAPHPHNVFLAFWLYGGLLGIFGFLGLIFYFFRDILSKENKNPARFVALGIMIYILIHGFFDTTYFKNDLAVIFWLCFLAVRNSPKD